MKKIALIMVCVLAAEWALAQSHNFRDTSYVRYIQVDMDSWLLSDTFCHRYTINVQPEYPGTNHSLRWDDILQYNYTDSPTGVEVVGLSALITTSLGALHYPMQPSEYLLLYDAQPDTFELKAQLQWEESDTAGRPHYGGILLVRDSSVIHLSCIHGHTVPNHSGWTYFTLFDLYFDNPITVYDSFYVGGTCRNLEDDRNYNLASYMCYSFDSIADSAAVLPSYHTLWKIFHYGRNESLQLPSNQWFWVPSDQFMMVIPIIRVVDTSFANAPKCPDVSGLFARGSYTETVTVQWDRDSLHSEFELSYGREGTAPDEGTIVTVNDNRWMFTDTAYWDTPMVTYVRTVCREYDTLRWSGWSSPVRWRLHHEQPADTSQHEGIEVPDDGSDLSRYVRLMPNPASGSVVVMSSYGIERVEVYDMRGERVMEQEGQSTTVGFDVSSWAKGAYVVLVRTPAGTASKRLVVGK